MNAVVRFWNRPETAARKWRAAGFGLMTGLLLGMILWGIAVFQDRFLPRTYELVVIAEPPPYKNPIWFWLDGEPFVSHQSFRYRDKTDREVYLSFPLERPGLASAVLEFGRTPNGRSMAESPAPADTQRIRIVNDSHTGHCTIVADIVGDVVRFRTEARDETRICVPAWRPDDRR
jgi:hypothetical protein